MSKNGLQTIVETFGGLSSIDSPSLGLDLDGVIDENPVFFSLLTVIWPGKVFVISYRNDQEKAIADLSRFNINYHELVLVNSFDAKAAVIVEKGIMVYIDDQPEMIKNIPPTVTVLLFRNEGNFDYNDERWMFSDRTAKLI